jgi:hypothetical protein
MRLCFWTLISRTGVAIDEPQGANLALHGVVWRSSRALAHLAGSNVREEASTTLWERLPLCCTDACPASSGGTMAHEAVLKEMKGEDYRQTSAV